MEIRPYQAGDEKHILDLFKISFGKPISEQYWKWRFADHPENKMMIMLMWEGSILAGHYAVSPVRMIVDHTEALTALSMTTMTHPDYAGRGIFTELAETLYEDQKKTNDLVAVWGYPNNNSHYGFIKNVKWKNLEQIPTFTLDANLVEVKETDINCGSSFESKHIETHDSSSYRVRVKRSQAYLNWRYTQNPTNDYVLFDVDIEGETHYAVAKKFKSFQVPDKYEIDLLEWEVYRDAKLQQQFLSAIKTYFGSNDLLCFNMWIPLNDARHITLEKIGFRNTAPITYSGIRLLNSKFDMMQQSEHWHYNLGYSDIY
ncbi:MAG: GNAT family N-acetyltransferase [Flavobacteriales bacterium]|nr:GNAT family N-acetyltransferase [Flavobacteriales bacterium]